jgi:hypothetical protein
MRAMKRHPSCRDLLADHQHALPQSTLAERTRQLAGSSA